MQETSQNNSSMLRTGHTMYGYRERDVQVLSAAFSFVLVLSLSILRTCLEHVKIAFQPVD